MNSGKSTHKLHCLGHHEETQGVITSCAGLVHRGEIAMVNFRCPEHCAYYVTGCKVLVKIRMYLNSGELVSRLLLLQYI